MKKTSGNAPFKGIKSFLSGIWDKRDADSENATMTMPDDGMLTTVGRNTTGEEKSAITIKKGFVDAPIQSAESEEEIYAPFKPDEEEPYIFISYAHSDRKRVFPIIKKLCEAGWHVWYDEGLPIGEDYLEQLEKHIDGAAAVLLFITEQSVQRNFVTRSEVRYAIYDADKRIILCYLDEIQKLPEGMNIALADRDYYPRIKEKDIEKKLKSIEGLKCFLPRKAEGYRIKINGGILDAANENDEYDFEKCEDGVRLTKYKGHDEDVVIPQIYKGEYVKELRETFSHNEIVRTVRIPSGIKVIDSLAFELCKNLADVYIPSSVQTFHDWVFVGTNCRVHCAKNSKAYEYVTQTVYEIDIPYSLSFELQVVVEEEMEHGQQQALPQNYCFCSFSQDKADKVNQIIERLSNKHCSIVSSLNLSEPEKSRSFRKAQCTVIFLTQGYIDDGEIEYLYRAIESGKNHIIYRLDDCKLPFDIDISQSGEQQLRYDTGTADDRLTKLIEWFKINNCIDKKAIGVPGFTYRINDKNEITLIKYIGDEPNVHVPGTYEGYPIIALEKNVFKDCEILTSVEIADEVKWIDGFSFDHCERLQSFVIPDSVSEIGECAFRCCISLKSLTIPSNVTIIRDSAFLGCDGLTDITIPMSVKELGSHVFSYCRNLENLTILDGIKTIPDYACEYCERLTCVKIPDTVTEIGSFAFGSCFSLTGMMIPNSVTRIGLNAFLGCFYLTNVTIPDSVTEIERGAFFDCASLTNLIIPDSVRGIGNDAFSGCPNLIITVGKGSFAKEFCILNHLQYIEQEAP